MEIKGKKQRKKRELGGEVPRELKERSRPMKPLTDKSEGLRLGEGGINS